MEITDIKIRKIITEGRLRAVVSITVDHMLAIHDIKIVQGDERLFIAMPSRKDENGIFRDIVHPIHADFRGMLEEEVIKAYEAELARAAAEAEVAALEAREEEAYSEQSVQCRQGADSCREYHECREV